jgi:hypothetical protein
MYPRNFTFISDTGDKPAVMAFDEGESTLDMKTCVKYND